ncbi:MAG: hypothetical protein IPJ65_29705 [Archangiaceae bacterium]|nr:hypothetical protein [Archangiaceae bacterium]
MRNIGLLFITVALGCGQADDAGWAEATDDADLPLGTAEVRLLPSADVGSWNMAGASWAAVDDGLKFAAADDAQSQVLTRAGLALGSHRVGYAPLAQGKGVSATLFYRAHLQGSASGTVQAELYLDDQLLASSDEHPVGAWRNYRDVFTVSAAPGGRLSSRLVFRNPSGRGALGYTQVWLSVAVQSGTGADAGAPPPADAGTPPPADAGTGDRYANARRISGTWVLQQIDSAAQLQSMLAGSLGDALDTPGVRGFSMRVAWSAVDQDFSLLNAGLKAARDRGLEFTPRFMAGRHSPARVFAGGAPYYLKGSEKVPAPFYADGRVNDVFEAAYDDFVGRLAAWCRQNGVHLLHLAWYGQDWAELNHGAEVRAAAGYTFERWQLAHDRLIDIGLKYATDALTVELPFSGYGPVTAAAAHFADHVVAAIGPSNPRFFCQSNGWGPSGDWGAPDASIEAQFDQVWSRQIFRGEQAIQPEDYDWSVLYGFLRTNHATYAEVYTPSFGLARAALLASELARFGQGPLQTP